ncbi:cytochrome C oxidase subunit IV family protein [Sagittula sp. S175]|uniref:cytochrome C oxidase subunit IV family protein n=1 Tax=Sagittula sp. S175 TaxID=3415129 RepID=UPI003C7E1048
MSVTRAWMALVALSLASTAMATLGQGGWLVVVVLGLAWMKARVVLDVYLGLQEVPGWRRGFSWGLCAFMVALIGLSVLG